MSNQKPGDCGVGNWWEYNQDQLQLQGLYKKAFWFYCIFSITTNKYNQWVDAAPENSPYLHQQENIPPRHDWLPGQHTLIALSSEDYRQRVQRKCIICSRIKHLQQKSSYRCSACGVRAVMCSPTTARNCFTYHIQHGIPA